jgi:hypothetical protein
LSSNDLILNKGIQDILHTLQHPSPASPVAPLTTNHYDEFLRITTLLTAIIPTPTPAATTALHAP